MLAHGRAAKTASSCRSISLKHLSEVKYYNNEEVLSKGRGYCNKDTDHILGRRQTWNNIRGSVGERATRHILGMVNLETETKDALTSYTYLYVTK